MFTTGLNPYGLTYTLGLQGAGTPRANPNGGGLEEFLRIARAMGARCVEIHGGWIDGMSDGDLARVRGEIAAMGAVALYSRGLAHEPGETLAESIRAAHGVGARLIRLHVTPVLEGARAKWGSRWTAFMDHARATLGRDAPRAADAGLAIAIEDHQDLGSEELVELADAAGDNVGIVFDTGNAFAVGEDPVAFAARAAKHIRHVHLKDYRAEFTDEGYRLVRCAIGDGCVPFDEIASVLDAVRADRTALTASIEPGALDARHIRAFTKSWWQGYASRDASEFGIALGRLRHRALTGGQDSRTPWEQGLPGPAIEAFEREQLHRSVEFLRARGWMAAARRQERHVT